MIGAIVFYGALLALCLFGGLAGIALAIVVFAMFALMGINT